MSLKSTYTNASIRGWTAGATVNYPWDLFQTIGPLGAQVLSLSPDNTFFVNGSTSVNTEIYQKSTNWTFLQTLTYSRAGNFQIDSSSISSNGTYVAIGAPFAGTPETYIFYKSGSTYAQQQLISGAGSFGQVVSLNANGDYLAVSDPLTASSPYVNVGTVYVYNRVGTTWSLQATITPPTPSTNLQFGFTTSMNPAGNILVIGALNVSGVTGFTYVYTRTGSTWTLLQTLTGGGLKNKIDASSTYIIAGDNFDNPVILFSYNGSSWSQLTAFPNPTTSVGYWGGGISISNDATTIVIGDANVSLTEGAIYMYCKNGSSWSLVQIITKTAGIGDFGSSINISDSSNTIIVNIASPSGVFIYTTPLFT